MVFRQWWGYSQYVLIIGFLGASQAQYNYCRMAYFDESLKDTVPSVVHVLGQYGPPCTYVNGNLTIIIYDVHAYNASQLDYLQFLLNAIEVVTGHVHIFHSTMPTLTFNNLQVIYAKELYEFEGRQYGLLLHENLHFQRIVMPKLSVVERGDIGFIRNDHFCEIDKQVDWRELWEEPDSQRFVMTPCIKKGIGPPRVKCNKACLSDPPTCWNESSTGCQLKSKCRQRLCSRCYYENGEEKCCDYQCLGGCYGPSPSQCRGCRHVYYNGICLSSCPTGTYQLHQLCLDVCPVKYLIQEGTCVETCSEGFYSEQGHCLVCSKGRCPYRCRLLDSEDRHVALSRTNLKNLRNCTFLEGSLVMDGRTFTRKNEDAIKTAEELTALENLQEITGVIAFDLKMASGFITNLDFLRNLRRIGAKFRSIYITNHAILIANYHGTTMGFQRLEEISGSNVAIFNCSKLIYGLTANWTKLGVESLVVKFSNGVSEGKCSEKCALDWGCFGPGDEMCLKCVHWRTPQHLCVSNCSSTGEHFTPYESSNEEISELLQKRECGQCHKQCVKGCTGPGPDHCLYAACKNVRVNSTCMESCPNNTYRIDKVCLPCDSRCHPRRETGLSVCHGPGPTNCNKCVSAVYNSTSKSVQQCLYPYETCPSGYYERTESPFQTVQSPEWQYLSQYNEDNQPMRVCRKCSWPCQLCDSYRCFQCSKVWLGENCVEDCPREKMPLIFRNITLSSNETCPLCDENCRDGCYQRGATFCFACRSYHVLYEVENSNETIKECVANCPADKPVVLNNGECHTTNNNPITWGRNVIAVLVVLSLLIGIAFVVTAFSVVFAKKRKKQFKREKRRLNDFFTNGTEMLTINRQTFAYKAPNLNRLQIINADDLIFEEGQSQLLGTGAFGEVYKAEWCFSSIQTYSASGESEILANTSTISPMMDVNQNGTIGSFWSTGLHSNLYRRKHKIFVAIKTINSDFKPDSQQKLQELFEEARVMASVRHANCLPLIGICLSKGRQCLVTAFMPLGSMDKYIQTHKSGLDAYTLFLWSLQIADGMNYLVTHGIIHRDLATRNVLLQHHDFVKITDFGLSKILEEEADNEIVVKTGRVPIRWLAIETLKCGVYSHHTDVWAYGVTLWEIFTFGETPYKELDTLQVRDFVLRGYTLAPPQGCHTLFYEQMSKCWLPEPENRPTFRELYQKCLVFRDEPDFYFSGCSTRQSVPFDFYQADDEHEHLRNKSSIESSMEAYTDMSRGYKPLTYHFSPLNSDGGTHFNNVSPEKQPFLKTSSGDEYVGSSNEWDNPAPLKSVDSVEDHLNQTVPSHVYEPIGAEHLGQSDDEMSSQRHTAVTFNDQYC